MKVVRSFVVAVCVFAPVCTAISAGASAATLPFCSDPWDAYAGSAEARPYRPLIEFERADRLGSNPSTAAGPLPVALRIELADEMRIGEYRVLHAPVTTITPGAGVAATMVAPNGVRCVIRPGDLASPKRRFMWGYTASRLAVHHLDSIDIDFSSALHYPRAVTNEKDPPVWRPETAAYGGAPCQTSNNHTHGLLVSPKKTGETLGDYIFDLTKPPGMAKDRCSTPEDRAAHNNGAHADIDNQLFYRIDIPKRAHDPKDSLQDKFHPSGLFWFHPHPHGYSAGQLNGGTSGLITVGRMCDYITDLSCETERITAVVRFMMLRDAQIQPAKDSKGAYDFRAATETTLCADANEDAHPTFSPKGECGYRGADPAPAPADSKWIFTVNGVQSPHIAFDPARADGEIWRIANSSPTVSYHLSIIPLDQATDATGPAPVGLCRKFFDVLSKDGAGLPDQANGAPTTAQEKEILLMPGARVEIRVRDLRNRTWALVQEGLQTGGDSWPRVVLAVLDPAKGPTDGPYRDCKEIESIATAPVEIARPQTKGPTIATAVAAQPLVSSRAAPVDITQAKACDPIGRRVRVIQFVKNNQFGDGDGWKQKDSFGVLAGLRDAPADDQPPEVRYFMRASAHGALQDMVNVPLESFAGFMTKPYWKGDASNFVPSFSAFPELGNICVTPDASTNFKEVWVIENWTNEIHNFHLHQTRFFVAGGAAEEGNEWLDNPLYFAFPCRLPAYDKDTPEATACNGGAPGVGFGDELIRQFYTGHASTGVERAASRYTAHDSVPVPRGTGDCDGVVGNANCQPGRVSLRIPFNRSEQTGQFVYHCHILEHEDRGMMGTVLVLPKPRQKAENPRGFRALLAWIAERNDPLANPPICISRPSR